MKIHRVNTIFQKSPADSGVACLGMVLGYYKYYEPLEKLRVSCAVSKNGGNSKYLCLAAEIYYNLDVKTSEYSIEKLQDLDGPVIIEFEERVFAVLEGKKIGRLFLNDPVKGQHSCSIKDFLAKKPIRIIFLKPNSKFKPQGSSPHETGFLFHYLYSLRETWILIFWIGILTAIPTAITTFLLQYFIDEVMTDKLDKFVIVLCGYGLASAASFFLQNLFQRLLIYLFNRGYSGTMENVFHHLLRLPPSYFSDQDSSEIAFKLEKVFNFFETYAFWHLPPGVDITVGCIFLVFLFSLNAKLTLISLSIVLFPIIINYLLKEKQGKMVNENLAAQLRLEVLTTTGITHIESIKAGVMQRSFFNKWANSLSRFVNKTNNEKVFSHLCTIVSNSFNYINSIIVIYFGVMSILEGKMTLGSLLAFITLMNVFATPIGFIGFIFGRVNYLKSVSYLIQEILDEQEDKRFAETSEHQCSKGLLEVKNLSFGYNRFEEPLIENLSFSLLPGKSIALVGGTGSGKTTLAKLVTGFLTPWSGEIELDGVSIYNYTEAQFHSAVATVSQKISTFNATLKNNLTMFNRKFDISRLHDAIMDAYLADIINDKGTINTVRLTESGSNFSGGQLQRIEIARAFAKNSPILVLDEATSALDPVTEEGIVRSIKSKGCSCLYIAHRLSTIRDCDEIIMLEKGKIIERGNHQQLMALDGAYAALMREEAEKGNGDAE